MTLGVKFLVGGVSLAAASCGGYVVYKKVADSGSEQKQDVKNESSGPTDGGTSQNQQRSDESSPPTTLSTVHSGN